MLLMVALTPGWKIAGDVAVKVVHVDFLCDSCLLEIGPHFSGLALNPDLPAIP